jgi:hypothetical protein
MTLETLIGFLIGFLLAAILANVKFLNRIVANKISNCRLFEINDWGQWEKIMEGDLTFCGGKCGRYIEQKRTCKLTGRVQFKETRT